MGITEKLEAWVPHKLSDQNKKNRREKQRKISLDIIEHVVTSVTGDEKWRLDVNMKQRKLYTARGGTPTPRVKQDLHRKMKMSYVWWDREGVVY